MRQLLKPHTRKWFGALANSNVWRAAVALQNIQWARSKRVCSFCGRKPARDYKLTRCQFDKDIPATMRLCQECFHFRQETVGDVLLPLAA